jgi:ABC-type antimicrobial peptide transport system permease subunit
LGPFQSPEGETLAPLSENEIALNSWAADELYAKIGDAVKISFFEPESVHGAIREKTVELKLTAIVKLAGAAEDRRLTPAVKGITDELTMADWDPPFPFDAKRIRPQDEKYWDDYGPTPKAFVSFATGKKLWGSRFGEATSIRVSNSEQKPQEKTLASDADRLDKYLRAYLAPASFGFVWQPVKLQGLAAAQGTTPFNVLFLCFSFFIIISAMMLVLLLFKLGVERRAAEIGILLAVGWKPKQVRRLLIREGILTAVLGGTIGVPLGIGYAALMLWGLQTLWLAAIVAPFLTLFITPESLAIGFFAGFFMAMLAILFAVRKISRLAPRKLLAGFSFDVPLLANGKHRKGIGLTNKRFSWLELLWIVFLLGNIVACFFARRSSELEAGMFFGSATVMLILTLFVIRNRLRRGAIGQAVAVGRGNLFRLALRNAARNPGRSALTVGLVASACFLIVAVSAFRLDPSQQTPRLESGNGGFALTAESSQPIFHDLDTPDGRAAMGFSDEEETLLASCKICCLRVRAGDDASCLNLYKPRSPRMLGLPTTFLERGGFAWAEVPDNCKNPWKLLDTKRAIDAPVESLQPSRFSVARKTLPMILEKNTANYSLNLWGGLGEIYNYPATDRENIPLQNAAMLDNSIFQGDLLISEEAMLKNFPETAGYRFFLVECPAKKTVEVQKVLENRLGDYGFAAETTASRLARFLAVQNTYLSTFQSLGGLGLLLGTLGLAAVQLRNVLERRGELALLRAVGFERKQLAKLVLMENAVLLILGLGSGVLAAIVAVMPHYATGNAPIPWASLVGILGLVFLVGTMAGSVAVRQIVKAPLLKSLRTER